MKTRHLFLTVCHKGKLHQFINTNSITGKYWIKFFIHVKSVTTSNVRTSFFSFIKNAFVKPIDLIFPVRPFILKAMVLLWWYYRGELVYLK